MENSLQNSRPVPIRPAWIRWSVILGAVWALLAITYAIMAVQSQRKQDKLIEEGVSQAGALAEQAGLPLLEQDIRTLHQMLKQIGDRPEVLYASVVDHKNKIIAYTDAGRLLPERQENVDQFLGVDTWQDHDAMIFSKPIYFGQTPIGEIRLAISLRPVLKPMQWFTRIAVAALIALVVLPLCIYGKELTQRISGLIKGRRADVDVHLLLCPLCGQTADHGAGFCQAANMDKAPVISITGNGTGTNKGSALRLSDIGSDPKLAFVKDQMIRQCAEIIKRLAVDHPQAGRRMREN